MAPTAKDLETLSATTAVVPPSAATHNPQATVTRPQPVPLEVAVSVNGARTIEGTDKREPFSESTKTVLVFANGAVIRLASSVSPGQLLFVTNEKSKKEVVCQVVKSKNYRTVTGYVELEFTEPAAGFWGVRIPTEQVAIPGATAKTPVAVRPVTPLNNPSAGAPKAPAVPVSVTTKPAVPLAALVNKPAVVPPAQPAAIPVSAPPELSSHPVQAKTPEPAKPEIKLPTIAEFLAASPVAPPPASPVKTESLPAQVAHQHSLPETTGIAATTEVPSTAPKSNEATTDQLRQQATRLQEQLSSLLFREGTVEKKQAPTVVAAPVESLGELAAAQKPPAEAPVPAPVVAHTVPPVAPEVKLAPPTIAVAETKPVTSAAKSSQFNLPVEEVKIPSWLAPLAREAENDSQSTSATEISESTGAENDLQTTSADFSVFGTEERSSSSQAVVFGGQLLGGASASEQPVRYSGSKKGLILGLAAAAAILIGAGAWYEMQPGNLLSGKAPGTQTIATNSFPGNGPAPNPATGPATSSGPINSVAPTVVNSHPAPTQPASTLTAEANKSSNATTTPETKPLNSTIRATPPVEEPRKPILGDVHLATPNVNRTDNPASSEAAPSIDSTDSAATSNPLVGLAAGNGSQPAAPLPIGGDVKPAQLLKSVPPVYPATAKTQRVAGDVKLDALIDADGNVTTTEVLSGSPLLHQAAAAAVKQWKYQPAMLDGKPTATHLTVTVQFRLQ